MPFRACPIRVLAVVAVLAAFPATAVAAGFEFGPQGVHAMGRGGAFVVGADDPSAIWWNPSRLALMRGTRLMYNHTLSGLDLSFQRAPAQKYAVDGKGVLRPDQPVGDPQTFPESTQTKGWFPMGVSLALTTDFGLKDWGFGIGLSGPAAFGSVGYPNHAPAGADDTTRTSSTRYSVISMDAMLAYLSVAAAYKYKEWFGIGATFQYVAVPYIKYSLDIVAPAPVSTQNDPTKTNNDMQVDLDVSDWVGFTGILGAWVRPLPCLELGMAARVYPIKVRAKGNLDISGTPNSIYPTRAELAARDPSEKPVRVPGRLSFDYPVDVKVGARYRHMKGDLELFDIEADFVWEQWSVMDAFRIKFDVNSVEAFGANLILNNIDMARNLKDTYSVRLGGTYQAIPEHLWVRLGGWWESGAQPKEFTIVDLPSWDRFGLGFGLSGAWRGLEVGLSYAHVFQLSRDVKSGTGGIRQNVLDFEGNVKSGYAVNEGKYSSSFDVISLGITILWEELVHGKKPGAPASAPPVATM